MTQCISINPPSLLSYYQPQCFPLQPSWSSADPSYWYIDISTVDISILYSFYARYDQTMFGNTEQSYQTTFSTCTLRVNT